MKRQGLILLSSAVLVIGGYALYDYKQTQRQEVKKQEASVISKMDEDKISYFLIEMKKTAIEVVRQDDTWKMLKPAVDSANQMGVKDFLHGVVTEKYLEVIKEGEGIDWSFYGLDQPVGTITLKDDAKNEEKISVGGIKNFEGNSYIRINGENKVMLASSTWFAKLEKKLSDFRDQRLMRLPNSQVTKLIFEKGKDKFTLTRKDGQWLNMEKLKLRVDQNKVREILGMLNTTEALDFISEGNITSADRKLWDLNSPALKLTAEAEGGKNWVGLFSSGRDKIYRVATNEPPFVMKLSPVDSQKFLLADFDSFRDRLEAFQFNRDKVKKIFVSGIEKPFDEELVRKIEKFNVTTFIEKTPATTQELKLSGEDGNAVFILKWGAPKRALVAGSETSVVEATSSAVDYPFTITEQEINSLKLFEKKEDKK